MVVEQVVAALQQVEELLVLASAEAHETSDGGKRLLGM
jgi:hypothetical protein